MTRSGWIRSAGTGYRRRIVAWELSSHLKGLLTVVDTNARPAETIASPAPAATGDAEPTMYPAVDMPGA